MRATTNTDASPGFVDAAKAADHTVNPGRRRALLQGAAALAVLPGASLGLAGCASPGAMRSDGPSGTGDGAAGTAAATDYRLANRLSWGATDAELERLRRLGRSGYIDAQLRAAAGPLPDAAQAQIDALRIQQRSALDLAIDIEAARKAGAALPDEPGRKAAREAYQQQLNRCAREAANRDLLRAVYSPNQLQEQLQWFWFNHFNVHQYKGNIRVLLGDYQERAIRPHALGRFRDLLGAVTRHPAMLRYLDNEQNAGNRINENLARELMELHTLGVSTGDAVSGAVSSGVPSGGGGYTQRDVQELARVLTGHGVNFNDPAAPPPKFGARIKPEQAATYTRDGAYEFNPQRHDFGDKIWLDRSVRGRGPAELDEVLDVLALHPATARFVSRKLARQLLADEPPPAVVDAMAAAWLHNDGRISDVLAVLLRSPEFSAPVAPGAGKFKDPVHYVVSAVRACYGERVVLNTQPMQTWLNRLGQGLYNRQTPDGYPSNAASWSGSGQIATRLDIARQLGAGSAGLFRTGAPVPGSVMQAMAAVDAASAASTASAPAAAAPAAPRDQPAFPQLARPIYWQVLRPQLAATTRQALDGAGSPQDWNTLYLSSPEFMYC